MNYDAKVELFARALASFETRAVARSFVGKDITRSLAAEARAAVAEAMLGYLSSIGSGDVADEVVGELVVVRHRFQPTRFAFAMVSALLPHGEDQTGDWERADDVPEAT